MDITAVNNRGATGLPAPAPPVPVDKAAENREIVQAVKALSGTEMFGSENELRFLKDPQTHRIVVKLVNRKTQEVLSQLPPEYVLRLAAETRAKR
jgi:uncharacterized FlaG/YvyC family protein